MRSNEHWTYPDNGNARSHLKPLVVNVVFVSPFEEEAVIMAGIISSGGADGTTEWRYGSTCQFGRRCVPDKDCQGSSDGKPQ